MTGSVLATQGCSVHPSGPQALLSSSLRYKQSSTSRTIPSSSCHYPYFSMVHIVRFLLLLRKVLDEWWHFILGFCEVDALTDWSVSILRIKKSSLRHWRRLVMDSIVRYNGWVPRGPYTGAGRGIGSRWVTMKVEICVCQMHKFFNHVSCELLMCLYISFEEV